MPSFSKWYISDTTVSHWTSYMMRLAFMNASEYRHIFSNYHSRQLWTDDQLWRFLREWSSLIRILIGATDLHIFICIYAYTADYHNRFLREPSNIKNRKLKTFWLHWIGLLRATAVANRMLNYLTAHRVKDNLSVPAWVKDRSTYVSQTRLVLIFYVDFQRMVIVSQEV